MPKTTISMERTDMVYIDSLKPLYLLPSKSPDFPLKDPSPTFPDVSLQYPSSTSSDIPAHMVPMKEETSVES